MRCMLLLFEMGTVVVLSSPVVAIKIIVSPNPRSKFLECIKITSFFTNIFYDRPQKSLCTQLYGMYHLFWGCGDEL